MTEDAWLRRLAKRLPIDRLYLGKGDGVGGKSATLRYGIEAVSSDFFGDCWAINDEKGQCVALVASEELAQLFADAPATAAELAELRRRLEESDRVAAAYRRQARSSILVNWQQECPGVGRAQSQAAADRVLDQIRDEAIAGGDPLCPRCRLRPAGISTGLCPRCDEPQGSDLWPE